MTDNLIVSGPEFGACRDRDRDQSIRPEHRARLLQHAHVVIDVLDHVEERRDIEVPKKRQRGRAAREQPAAHSRAGVGQRRAVHVDACHLQACSFQCRCDETSAASDVE